MERIRGIIIHLERATERADHVAALRARLPMPSEILPAVDARTGVPDGYSADLGLDPPYPFALHASEIAIFHSHRTAWSRIVEDDLDAGLILEDDVVFDPDRFPKALDAAQGVLSAERLIRLPIKDREADGVALPAPPGIRITRPRVVGLNLQAQLVGREAARRLLEASEHFDRPVDSWLQMTWIHGVDILSVWPSGVSEMSADLGGSTQGKRRGALTKLSAEFRRARYRRAIARRSARLAAGK